MESVTMELNWPALHLLGGPYVMTAGRRVSVPEGSKRLIAYVALNDRRVERSRIATVLWPDADRARAAGNLRSATWRLRCAGIDILHADKSSLVLQSRARVDVEGISDWANRL